MLASALPPLANSGAPSQRVDGARTDHRQTARHVRTDRNVRLRAPRTASRRCHTTWAASIHRTAGGCLNTTVMAAGDDGVEQQLIQQLDALIDEPADDELAAARGRRTLMDELLQKSPRVAPEGGGALLFNASPRVAPSEGAAPLTSSPRVKPLWRSEASPRIAPDGGGAILFNASPRVAPVGVPEGAAPVPRVEPSRASPRVAPSDGGGAFLFNASPRVAPEGAPVRTQASQPQGASPRVAPAGGGEIPFNASPRIAPDGIPVQSQASRASPRIAPIGGPAAETRPPSRTDKRPGRCDACGWRTCQCPPPPPPPTWQPQY